MAKDPAVVEFVQVATTFAGPGRLHAVSFLLWKLDSLVLPAPATNNRTRQQADEGGAS